MSDFEDRLRDALRAVDAPDATGLADAARRRARTRRRTTIAATAIAVLAAVVAVPVTLAALSGNSSHVPTVVDPTPASPGLRVETWHQATILVPSDWGYGTMTAWCASGGDTSPVVERPGGAARSILCTEPASSYGVSFEPAGKDAYDAPRRVSDGSAPEGSWVGEQTVAGVRVSVVTPTRAVAQQILDSMQVVGNLDPNGCSEISDFAAEGPDDGISVCRYDGQHQLVQSEVLSGADADAARAAIAAAPETTYAPPCPGTPVRRPSIGDEFVILNDHGTSSTVRWTGQRCADWGVFAGGVRRTLTEDVMYWALSPGWSGGVDGDVPLPGDLRR